MRKILVKHRALPKGVSLSLSLGHGSAFYEFEFHGSSILNLEYMMGLEEFAEPPEDNDVILEHGLSVDIAKNIILDDLYRSNRLRRHVIQDMDMVGPIEGLATLMRVREFKSRVKTIPSDPNHVLRIYAPVLRLPFGIQEQMELEILEAWESARNSVGKTWAFDEQWAHKLLKANVRRILWGKVGSFISVTKKALK